MCDRHHRAPERPGAAVRDDVDPVEAGHMDAAPERYHRPARPAVHGRGRRLPAADRRAADQEADHDADEAGPSVRRRRRAQHPEPGRRRLQGVVERGHVDDRPAADRPATSNGCSMGCAPPAARSMWTRSARRSAGFAKREFVLRRAGKDHPEVFTTRWAMSYLRGPLTREQIAALTDENPAAASISGRRARAADRPAAASAQRRGTSGRGDDGDRRGHRRRRHPDPSDARHRDRQLVPRSHRRCDGDARRGRIQVGGERVGDGAHHVQGHPRRHLPRRGAAGDPAPARRAPRPRSRGHGTGRRDGCQLRRPGRCGVRAAGRADQGAQVVDRPRTGVGRSHGADQDVDDPGEQGAEAVRAGRRGSVGLPDPLPGGSR